MTEKSVTEIMNDIEPFELRLPNDCIYSKDKLTTLQVNIGYMCNLSCRHCHLSCGPNRTEIMNRETMQACIDAFKRGEFESFDITGGAPEMNPDFEWLLDTLAKENIRPMCRTNLCILTKEKYTHFAKIYAQYDVTLVASLPHYAPTNCDKVRGHGTFDKDIEALKLLNAQGFGTGKHTLILVYNPAGAILPASQSSLEKEYKAKLAQDYDVYFDSLIAIANNPSGRFAEALNKKGNLEKYMKRLCDAFNPATCESMMCRDQINVDYKGDLYDCDFNQALGLKTLSNKTIFDLAKETPESRKIIFANHCYGCTAGSGSSCGGATA